MKAKRIFSLRSNERIARDVYRMRLEGDTSPIGAPGQFVNIELDGLYLRRPFSVCDYDENTLTIIYKIVGRGTERMAGLLPGTELDLLLGLGNGYDIAHSGNRPLLIGGGVGVPPLYALAKKLIESGRKPLVALGFNTAKDVFYETEFRALGISDVSVSTVDGSHGAKGFVTGILPGGADYVFCCGPHPMLKAVYDHCALDGQFSFEERMGCGFGACMGCTCRTKYGARRICVDGPVLRREEIVW